MKRQTYDGANLVTTAVAETFCLILVLNSKKMSLTPAQSSQQNLLSEKNFRVAYLRLL